MGSKDYDSDLSSQEENERKLSLLSEKMSLVSDREKFKLQVYLHLGIAVWFLILHLLAPYLSIAKTASTAVWYLLLVFLSTKYVFSFMEALEIEREKQKQEMIHKTCIKEWEYVALYLMASIPYLALGIISSRVSFTTLGVISICSQLKLRIDKT